VAFSSDGGRDREVDIRIGNANAVLRELHRSVVSQQQLSNTAKLSVFESVLVPILTYVYESWVMTVRILSQVQAAEMGVLRRVDGVRLCDKVRGCKIRKALNVKTLVRIKSTPSYHVLRIPRQD